VKTPPDRPDPDFTGTSRFEIVRRLGAGGMGVVYEAIDHQRKERVALKALKALGPTALIRFKSEFRALCDLEHPNLVNLLELEGQGEAWFFTMELVEGKSLLGYIRTQDVTNEAELHTIDALAATVAEVPDDDSPTDPDSTIGNTVNLRPRSHKPPSLPRYHEARLWESLKQLAVGLEALHAAQKVHRDVKPSNVRVTPEGRVVLLDFGLVRALDESEEEGATNRYLVGTVEYMAPEQAAGVAVGPAADWYAFGVILYEALSGRLPFSGPWREVLARKQAEDPPELVATDAPPALVSLCRGLLRRNPSMRATGAEVLATLGGDSPLGAARLPFVGRVRELGLLEGAFADTRLGRGAVALVEGESGVGKTALVRELTRRLHEDVEDLVVLHGRYYEREAVPYRAFDGVLDAAARFLLGQPADLAASILPVDIDALGAVFPVMAAVRAAIDPDRPLSTADELDPHIRRARMFAAARELFTRLARRFPTVVVIDDIQWSDADSRVMLLEVLRAPAAPLLVVATLRSVPEDPGRATRSLEFFRQLAPMQVGHLKLSGLSSDEGRALVAAIAPTRASLFDEPRFRRILDESAGHPMFLAALCARPAEDVAATLDDVLRARVATMSVEAQALLQLTSLSPGPLAQEVALRASGLPLADYVRATAALRTASLLRATRERNQDAIEPFHDRVREAIGGMLSVEQRRQGSARLGAALESLDWPDAETLFRAWRAADDRPRAATWAERAAQKASQLYAFDRAASLYTEAFALSDDALGKQRLRRQIAQALIDAGRGPEAALALTEAAKDAAPAEALELRRRAAEQLLRSGRIDEGLTAIRGVLNAVGMRFPPGGPRTAIASLLGRRLQLSLRGEGYTPRAAASLPAEELTRIDVCWSVAGVLSMVDTVRGAYFQTRHLLLALRAGEPFRIARAFSVEAGFSAASGGSASRRTARLLDVARAMSVEIGDPYLAGWVRGCAGVAAGLEGRFVDALTLCKEGEAILAGAVSGVAWEKHTMVFFRNWSLAYLGQLTELGRLVPEDLRHAEERGDLYGVAVLRMGLCTLPLLAADDPDAVRSGVELVMQRWSHRAFMVEHWWELLALCQADLYDGSDEAARAMIDRIDHAWPPMRGSAMLRVQLTRLEATHLRARALVHRARAGDRHAARRAEADARAIARERMPWSTPLGLLIEAALLSQRGDKVGAIDRLAKAEAALDSQGMVLYAAAARRRHAELSAGEGAAAVVAAVDEWLRGRGVRDPVKFSRMLAPGF